jgi:hypothetical protein
MPLQPEKLPTMPLSELVKELHKREESPLPVYSAGFGIIPEQLALGTLHG